MSSPTIVSAEKAPRAVGPYCHARWAGELLYTSGQLGLDPASGQLVPGGAPEQGRQALVNLGQVLAAAGLSFADVVKANVYLVDMAEFAAFNQVYAEFFKPEAGFPARTCLAVAGLPLGGRVEIELVAKKERE